MNVLALIPPDPTELMGQIKIWSRAIYLIFLYSQNWSSTGTLGDKGCCLKGHLSGYGDKRLLRDKDGLRLCIQEEQQHEEFLSQACYIEYYKISFQEGSVSCRHM